MGCDIHVVLEVHDKKYGWVGLNSFPYFPMSMFDMDTASPPMGTAKSMLPLTWNWNWKVRVRNYDFFADLAGVRGYTNPAHEAQGVALGLPDDASQLTLKLVGDWEGDGHSHSWLPAREFARLHMLNTLNKQEMAGVIARRFETGEDMLAWYTYQLLGVNFEGDNDRYRVVFWFDN